MSCSSFDTKTGYSASDLDPDLSIKNLRHLAQNSDDISNIKANTNDIYLIVHPSYYLFFEKHSFNVVPSRERNVVEEFTQMIFYSKDPVVKLMKVYERNEMEFIASSREDGRIVLLILPGKYATSNNYIYKNGIDEYARYLNDIAKNSNTIFYVESIKTNSGKIAKSDMDMILDFLQETDAKNIFVGGGYIGRCQEEFHKQLLTVWPHDKIAVIPEISAFSPNDMNDSTAKMLLTYEMKLNTIAANYFIKNGGLKSLNTTPNLKNLNDVDVNFGQ